MSADDNRAAFVAWIRDDGYLVPSAVTEIEWDDEGLPLYYTIVDGVRHYLDGEWHAWQAAIAAEREAAAKVAERFYAGPGGASRDNGIRRDAGRSIAAAIRARGAS